MVRCCAVALLMALGSDCAFAAGPPQPGVVFVVGGISGLDPLQAVAPLVLPLAVVVVLKGKVWTGLLGMFIVILLVIGAIRLSRPHAPWARWRYTTQPDKMRRALERERRLRRPVVRAKLWVQ